MYELGIDLGTTYTAAAIRRDDRVEIAPLGARNPVIPSVVLLSEDGTTATGEAAQRRALTEPTRVAREFKRRIGDPLPVIVGGSPHSAESLSAMLLKAVVDTVTQLEGGAPGRVALTHPANWGSYKKDLYAQAVRFADLPNVVFLTEPEAAAIHYASQERVDTGALIAVYDLGGGTFDATILRKQEAGAFDVVGQPEGIERLGGIDFDQAVFSYVAEALGGALDDLDRTDPGVLSAVARLRQDCIDAKEALSVDTETSIPVALPGLHTEVRITRPELESMLRRPIADTVSSLRRALRDAGHQAEELTAVLLVGGSSRIPMVAEMVASELGIPVATDAHPKYAIAMGAARYAGLAAAQAQPAALPIAVAAAAVPVPPPAPAAPPPHSPQPAAAAPAAPAAPAAAPMAAAPTPTPPAAVVQPASAPRPPATVEPPPPPIHFPVGASSAAPDVSEPQSAGGGRRSKLLWPLVGVAAAAVLAVGAVVALSGSDDEGGGTAGCPSEGPFLCITSARIDGGNVVAQFQQIDYQLSSSKTGRFFIESSPSAFVEWSTPDPFQASTGSVAAGSRLCSQINNDDGSPVAGSGNCVTLEGN